MQNKDTNPKSQNPVSERAKERERQATRRRAQARQKLLALLVLVVIVINGLLGYWLYDSMVVDVQERRLQEQTQERAREQALRVENYLQDLRTRVTDAAALPDIEEALAEQEPEALQNETLALAERFPEALAVRLIPKGTAQLERDHAAPISFAELDLIRRAENRADAHPEMARDGDNLQLHLIEPIPAESSEAPSGTLMVTLDSSELLKRFSVGDSTLGQARLTQRIPGSGSQLLFQHGDGATDFSHQVTIPQSHWQVEFRASEELARRTEEMPALWLVALSATSIVSLLLAWLISYVVARKQQPRGISSQAAAQNADLAEVKAAEAKMTNPLYHNQDILDIAVADEDQDILGLDKQQARPKPKTQTRPAVAPAFELPMEIFRAYDIRARASQLTQELTEHLGRALGSEALDQGETHILVARDGRTHSPELSEHLIRGITETGCHVINLGVVPSPVMYFATHHLSETSSGVMVTASHNPADYNGFKMVINGVTLADEAVLDIRSRISRQEYHSGHGDVETLDVVPDYIDRILSDVALVGDISLVIDAGNAVPGAVAPRLFEELGCQVTPLYCDLDGTFPNHCPDPTKVENLQDLIAKVQEVNADLGVAFDGDGDRLVVVTPKGQIIWPDHLLMLFARDILSRHPGADVIFDVKCSRQLNQVITSYGGRPIMWKTGHSPMKAKMIETQALIGGEYSGHIFIKDRWYGFDDGLYTMARLLEIITLRDQGIDEAFEAFPILPSTPELKIEVPEERKFDLVEQLVARGDFKSGKATTIDGLRVDFAKGWGLVRASNTSAALTLRFEAESEEALKTIQQLFKRELLKIDSNLKIDF